MVQRVCSITWIKSICNNKLYDDNIPNIGSTFSSYYRLSNNPILIEERSRIYTNYKIKFSRMLTLAFDPFRKRNMNKHLKVLVIINFLVTFFLSHVISLGNTEK